MRALVQRVSRASVTVEGEILSEIGQGLLVLLGVTHQDTPAIASQLAGKVARLRIFRDEQDKMNRSVQDIGGSILVVSQFTLYADTRRGNRPGFDQAAAPVLANELYEYFCNQLRACGLLVGQGRFGADMQVSLVNAGPVTLMLEINPDKS